MRVEDILRADEELDPIELRDALRVPSMRRALADIVQGAKDGASLMLFDLTTPEGIEKAREAQALARGTLKVVEQLAEMTDGR